MLNYYHVNLFFIQNVQNSYMLMLKLHIHYFIKVLPNIINLMKVHSILNNLYIYRLYNYCLS